MRSLKLEKHNLPYSRQAEADVGAPSSRLGTRRLLRVESLARYMHWPHNTLQLDFARRW